MSNQSNYVEQIVAEPRAYTVSRIAVGPDDSEVLLGRQPGEFGFDADDNVEMHFYDSSARLVGSVVVPVSSGIISSRTIITPNSPKEEKVVIDMTRVQKELGLLVTPGIYTVTLNFFSDEVGSFTGRKLTIDEVSLSRTELRLKFDGEPSFAEQNQLFEFSQPSIPRVLAEGLMETTIGLSNNEQKQQFIDAVNAYLIQGHPTLIEELIDLDAEVPDNLNQTIDFLSGVIYDEFVALLETTKEKAEFDRLQSSELKTLLETAVDRAFVKTNVNLFTQGQIRYV